MMVRRPPYVEDRREVGSYLVILLNRSNYTVWKAQTNPHAFKDKDVLKSFRRL